MMNRSYGPRLQPERNLVEGHEKAAARRVPRATNSEGAPGVVCRNGLRIRDCRAGSGVRFPRLPHVRIANREQKVHP